MDLVVLIAAVAFMYLAGELAVRRGRARRPWIWVAAFIGPFAIAVIYLLPRLDVIATVRRS